MYENYIILLYCTCLLLNCIVRLNVSEVILHFPSTDQTASPRINLRIARETRFIQNDFMHFDTQIGGFQKIEKWSMMTLGLRVTIVLGYFDIQVQKRCQIWALMVALLQQGLRK